MWSEGPTWDRDRQQLYFTDVPGNIAYVWRAGDGVNEFLKPSGSSLVAGFREPGANGLLFNRSGDLIICNHGKRAVEIMDIESRKRRIISSRYQGNKFNSPNDVAESRQGEVFFTDPPYGLEGLDQSPLKDLSHNGVYRQGKTGEPTLLIHDMTFPNGIALSRDETRLYVSQSDPNAMHIYVLDITGRNEKKLFVDLSDYADATSPGLPDGMAMDIHGNLFATGPGGVFVIDSTGKVLGRIKTGKASANCTFGEDGHSLFITNHDRLLKLRVRTKGMLWG